MLKNQAYEGEGRDGLGEVETLIFRCICLFAYLSVKAGSFDFVAACQIS